MGDTTVSGNLGVDVTTLLLIQVDFCLQDVDLLRLTFKLCSEQVLLHLDVALLLLVLIVEDVLVIAIKLSIELQLFGTKILDHIEQVSVHSDLGSKFTLSGC